MPLYLPCTAKPTPVASVESSRHQVDVARGVSIGKAGMVERQQLDVDARLLLRPRIFLQHPVFLLLGVLLERQVGFLEMHFRDHYAAGEERQHLDRRLDRVGLEEIFGLAPLGVGESDSLGAKARMEPAPCRGQPRDDQLAVGRLAHGARDRPLEEQVETEA
jgi:hypothetical protein